MYYSEKSMYFKLEAEFRKEFESVENCVVRAETHYSKWSRSTKRDADVIGCRLLGFDPKGRGRQRERIWIVARIVKPAEQIEVAA